MNKLDHNSTIHRIPTIATPITSDESQSCKTTHKTIVLTNMGERVPTSYCQNPQSIEKLLMEHHGGGVVEGDGFRGQSPSRQNQGLMAAALGVFSGKSVVGCQGYFDGANIQSEWRRKAAKEVPRRPLGVIDFWVAPAPCLAAAGPILDKVLVHVDQRKISRNFCDRTFQI